MCMEKDLLQRYVEGNVSQEEVDAVVDWLDADPEHVREFMALHKVYDITVMNQSTFPSPEVHEKKRQVRFFITELLKVAAIVLLVLGIQQIIDYRQHNSSLLTYQTLYVPAGQRAELLLPDSTHVWLNAHSRLVYPVTFNRDIRSVELEGEAYFDVKRNEQIPFLVKTPKMNVRVLGTEFNVSAYAEEAGFEVALLEGSVELETDDQTAIYQMQPGEQVRYVDGKYESNPIEELDYFKWKEGLICFRNQPISEIVEKLSLYFDVQIEVLNPDLLNEYYTGKFRTKDGVEQVLKVLQLEHHFQYEKDNEQNKITIK